MLPVISDQHQAQAGSRERVEISGRKYDPALTQTERVLWGGVRSWACITENKSISAARTTTQPHTWRSIYTLSQPRSIRRHAGQRKKKHPLWHSRPTTTTGPSATMCSSSTPTSEKGISPGLGHTTTIICRSRGTHTGPTWILRTTSSGFTGGVTGTECSAPSGWRRRSTPRSRRTGKFVAAIITTRSSSTRRA